MGDIVMAPTTIRIALDWTPNTIHSGLYLAQKLGYYEQSNLQVELLPPDKDYSKTPAKRLEAGEVDLAICPSESCIAYNESGKMRLQAIYAILQRDASAIASIKLNSMKELGQDKKYGSYNARYEDAIVKAMVDKDGGSGQGVHIERSEGKLSMFDAVKAGRIDATWIFLPWEGVEAELEGVKANYFQLGAYGIPYGFSPVIARNVSRSPNDQVLKEFVAATRKGYQRAIEHPRDVLDVLGPLTSPKRSHEFLLKSQERISEYYSVGPWNLGAMRSQEWDAWLSWLRTQRLLTGPHQITEEDVWTDKFGH